MKNWVGDVAHPFRMKFRRNFPWFFTCLALGVGLFACSRSGGRSGSPIAQVGVSSTQPADGETNVPVDTWVIASFGEGWNQIDPTRFDSENFSLLYEGVPIRASVTFPENQAVLIPVYDLSLDSTFVAVVSNIEDSQGRKFLGGQEHRWSFSTVPHSPSLNISLTEPLNGLTEIPGDTQIRVTFSHPIDPAS